MIRPFTCVCMLLAAGSGLYLYQTKHRAQMLDREIQRTIKQTEAARDRIGVLRGEWALLSEPERLSELSSQHLGLKTLDPKQFVALVDLNARLPAPMPAGTTIAPLEEPVAEPIPLAAAKQPQQRIAAVAPAAAPTRPVQVATLTPPPHPAAKPAAVPPPALVAAAKPPVPVTAAAQPVPRIMAPVVSVSAAPITAPPVQAPARIQGLSSPQMPLSIGESVARAARTAAGHEAPTSSVQASAAVSTPAFASALGGARGALPAPVPYGTPQLTR